MSVKGRMLDLKCSPDVFKTFFLREKSLRKRGAGAYQVSRRERGGERTDKCFGQEFRLIKLPLSIFTSKKRNGEDTIKMQSPEVLVRKSDEGLCQRIGQRTSSSIFEGMNYFAELPLIRSDKPKTVKGETIPFTSAASRTVRGAREISPAGWTKRGKILGNLR